MSSSYNDKLDFLKENIRILVENQDLIPRSTEENENKEITAVCSPIRNAQLSAGDTVLLKDFENLLVNGIINPSHTIATNWMKLIDYFQMRISNMCVKLMNIEKGVQEIDEKLINICFAQENSSNIKRQFQETLNAYNQDISTLENDHFKQLLEFEEKLSQELNRLKSYYRMKNEDLKINYEKKLQDLVKNYEERLNVQNIKIERLNSIIEDEFCRLRKEVKKLQYFSKQNEPQNLDYLKRKMETLREFLVQKEQEHMKCEKACAERFSVLLRKHELREKSLQIQLAAQRAELTIHKDEPDDENRFLQSLEKRYQKLLIQQRRMFIDQHIKDAKTIDELQEQLKSYQHNAVLDT